VPAGSLTLYRRHARNCSHRSKGRRYSRCNCGIWVQGSLGGRWVKDALNTRDWSKAAATIHGWESSGEIGVIRVEIPTITQAVEKYFDDATARHLAATTIRKRRELLEGKLLPFCKTKGLDLLKQMDVPILRSFRNSWPYSALSAVKRLEYLRSFLRFCQDSGWIESNPAMVLKPPKVTHRPTLPFEDSDIERILKATDTLSEWGTFGPKARAMVLLLRYSGLRMQDAACLERRRLKNGKLFLYTQKTGTPVYCPLPPAVATALNGVENAHPDYFFWDRRSERETTVKSWNRVFRKIFATTDPKIDGGHPHRFRDTFAVALLLNGVELSHVSILLGHASIKITERHYAPWVKARQKQLEDDVRKTWGSLDLAQNGPARDDTGALQLTAAP
jgi:integrase/recombinase XerD